MNFRILVFLFVVVGLSGCGGASSDGDGLLDSSDDPNPTPTAEATPLPTSSPDPEPSPDPSSPPDPSPTPEPSQSPDPTATPNPSLPPDPTMPPAPLPTATPNPTATPAPTPSPTSTPAPSPTAEPTVTPTPTPTSTPAPTATPTATPSPTAAPTPTATPTASPSPTSTPFPTSTPLPADQCNTTAQCVDIFGSGATDCLNSQSDQSICMCGSDPCSDVPVSTPTPTVSPTPTPSVPPQGACAVSGDLAQWHRVALTCSGNNASEDDDATFMNFRFDVTFSQGAKEIRVPGHFAADGNAADTGASSGDQWRAYFSPPSTGVWQYEVSFRQGDQIAVSSDASAGLAVASLDGLSGQFSVSTLATEARDMRGRGLLRRETDERYLRFAGDNSIYIEAGMDSPENIFGYSGFDNTTKHLDSANSCKGLLHDFAPHEDDWNSGDPTWNEGKGKSLIGLVNYIASTGVNAVYIMAMTVKSDGCDAHPWTDYDGNRRAFDVSKLDQWERALTHMTEKGLLIHLMTQETENDNLLNNGNLGFERKLYYRELISRFGHHPALQWNLGEENTNTTAQRKAYADFIRDLDPYDHPIFMHTYPNQHAEYDGLLGHATFDGPTFQFGAIPQDATGGVYGKTIEWINRSREAGVPWVVTMTEASGGQAPTPNSEVTSRQRIYWMWANVMAGGGGFEWYLKNAGSGHAYDLAVEDLREFDAHWLQSGHFARFFRDILQADLGVNLQSLSPDNSLTSTGTDWVLADPGLSYLIFLREGGNTNLTLPDDSQYQVLWFNPRTGEHSQGTSISGTGPQSLGSPPSQTNQDWVVVVTRGEQGLVRHPDIVSVIDIDPDTILQAPRDSWMDSYSVGDQCYCDSTFDHNIGDVMVTTDLGTLSVRETCEAIGPGPGSAGRPKYNDVQCGNGPSNDQADESYCPGRIDVGAEGCGHIGPRWQVPVDPNISYVEADGLVVMEAENTPSDLDLWHSETDISGYTGSGYIEFDGNSALNGPARSPLTYTFTVNQGGLYYLHLRAAKEHVTIDGELRTDVANDAYVRLEGDFGPGPNAGGNHGDDAPLSSLQNNTKFFGGQNNQFAWASGNRLDLGGHNNKRVAIYDLKAGETYVFTMSGRSRFFKVDRIVFRHQSVSASQAQNISLEETRE